PPGRAEALRPTSPRVPPFPQAAVPVRLVAGARRGLFAGAVAGARGRAGRRPARPPGSPTAAAHCATDGADRRARHSADGRALGDVLAGGALDVGIGELTAFPNRAGGLLPAGLLQLLVGLARLRL